MILPEDQTTVDDPSGTTETESSGESELDAFLKEYEASSKEKSRTKPDAKPPDLVKVLQGLQPVVKFASSKMEQEAADTLKKDVDGAIDFLIEPDELTPLPKKWARGFLEVHAIENPTIGAAFENRATDPAAWSTALESTREALLKAIKELPGDNVKSDVEAATAAVQGTSTESTAEEGPSIAVKAKMSDREWAEYKESKYAAVE